MTEPAPRKSLVEALSETWPVRLAKGVAGAAMLPGDVYTGRVPSSASEMTDEEFGRVIDLAGLSGSGALMTPHAAAQTTKKLASRSASIYNPPKKSPRSFEADYPSGALADDAGKLAFDIDGRPLSARYVVGRGRLSGPDVELPRQALDEIAKARTGEAIRSVAPRSPELGNDLGRAAFRSDGRPDYVAVSRSLSEPARGRVEAHEIGHVIDKAAGEIPVSGLDNELRAIFNDLNNPQSYGKRFGPEQLRYRGAEVPRELMAESIRSYMADPNYIKTVAPKTAARIREYVNSNPELAPIVQFNLGAPEMAIPSLSAPGLSPDREAFAEGGPVGNWWEAAPLAPSAEPKAQGADWWSAAPLADPGVKVPASFDERFGDGPMAVAAAKPGVLEDVAKTVPSALARGVAGVAGIPGLVSGGADWLFSKVTGTSPEELEAAREAQRAGSRANLGFALPSAGDVLTPEKVTGAVEGVTGPLYKPQTNTGRYVGAVAEMAPGALMGGGSAWERALSTIGAGIGSEGGGDLFKGTWFEPYAKIVGGILGGVGGAVAPTVAERGFAGVKNTAKSATAPMREQGRRDLAGKELLNRAENPTAFRAALEDPATMYPGAKPGEIVPGSAPTTFQRTGDMGIGSLEREVATANPTDFMTRRAEQNAARVGALDAVQPTGSAADVSGLLRRQLQDLDDETQAIVERVTRQAREATDAAVPAIGADDVGNRMRDALAAARAEAKTAERALWRAVDPDGTMTINVSPLRNTAREIEAGLNPMARALEGEEQAIVSLLRAAPDEIPFESLRALRSRITGAMSEEMRAKGATPAYARLTQLRGALENTIDTAVQRRVAQEADAVATGVMRAEDTIEARLRAESQQWRDARAAAAGTNPGAGDRGPAGGGASAFSRDAGAEVPGAGRPGDAPGGPGVSVNTPLDEAAAERLRAASAATKARAQTYDRGPAGDAMKTTGFSDDFKALPGAVPSKFFTAGPTGADRVGAYMAAVKNPEQAAADLGAAAAASLRQSAIRADGTLDPRKFDTWLRQHGPALDAAPGIRDQFSTAARATQAVETAALARRQALDAAQAGVVGRLIGVTDPQDVVKAIGGIFGKQNGVQEMRKLVLRARATPEGMAGLRRAVAEHINSKLMTNAEAATSGTNLISANAFQNFVKQNRDTLRQVFTAQEVEMMDRIAQDIARANRSVTAIKLPGGSNTAQDLMAQAAKGGESLLSRILRLKQAESTGAGAAAGWLMGGLPGAVVGAGAGWANSARQAGLQKVRDIVKEALLDPALARTLLKEAPVKMDRGPWLELGRQLGRLGVFGAEGAASDRQDKRERLARASGGVS